MRQRGVSNSVIVQNGGDGSLTNPGTEVTINCVNIANCAKLFLYIQVYAVDSRWVEKFKNAAQNTTQTLPVGKQALKVDEN